MMRLSTMWKVDATIDAAGSSPVAERILASWPHEAGSARFFRSSGNFLYTFRSDDKRYYLRFADSSERSLGAIEVEVDLISWLANSGIQTAAVVPARDGELVTTTQFELGSFHAVVFAEIPGAQYELNDLAPAHFAEWGAALGKLHRALKGFPRQASIGTRSWHDELAEAGKLVPADALAVRNELDSISRSLNQLPVDGDRYGLIHSDFELDNLVWGHSGIGILDFDDSMRCWYAADIAFALRDLFADGGVDLTNPSFLEFVQGYAAQCALDEAAIGQLPMFLRLSRLLQYARISRALDLYADGNYPDWLIGLQAKLRGRNETYQRSLGEKSKAVIGR
jgi:Ser/Thr protein kinase RdoA (MazF antagonist)